MTLKFNGSNVSLRYNNRVIGRAYWGESLVAGTAPVISTDDPLDLSPTPATVGPQYVDYTPRR